MKYFVYNKLSKSGSKTSSREMFAMSDLNDEFYKKLTADDEVVLHGGDGTINTFINKCYTYPNLTIVKAGTGNDLARELQSEFQTVSIFDVNGKKYVNGFDVGYGALVCKLVEEDDNKTKMSYLKNVYLGLRKTNFLNGTITVDGTPHKSTKTFLIAVQNSKYFGGGMSITPNANITSKTVELCVIGGAPKYLIAAIFPTVFKGKHTIFSKFVKMYRGREVAIELDQPYIGECDGEVLSPTKHFIIKFAGQIKIRLQN